jgi:cytochrome c oxidase cbb3-type subunit 3
MEIKLMMRNRKWILLLCMSLVLAVQAADVQPDNKMSSPAVLVMESPYSFEETVNNLRDAIGDSNFRMIREQPWDYGLESEVTHSHDAILYFCNFDMVNSAIKLDQRVGQLLPFRVTIMEQGDRVLVMAVKPEAVMRVMDNPRLGRFRTRVASMYRKIIEEGLF